MSQPLSKLASRPLEQAAHARAAQTEQGPFVINLSSSSTPMALIKPDAKELARFSFFISRRREDGRERFRLHMGHFTTRAEANEWLGIVREVYPAAWIGEAPGKRLAAARANAAAASASSQTRTPTPQSIATPAQTASTSAATTPAAPQVREQGSAITENSPLSDSQVLHVLEERRAPDSARSVQPATATAADAAIAMVKPADTQSLRAIKEDVSRNAPVQFAVQLAWSVTPIDLATVPPLAIFSAYSLYCVEGNRDGRKWYGLRLGFFKDASSAKQVAYYVRSEFNSVAVVPVADAERRRAIDKDESAKVLTAPVKARQENETFTLIDEPAPRVAPPESAQTGASPAPRNGAATAQRPAPGRGGANGAKPRAPRSLDETLEILGAGELTLDQSPGTRTGDSGVRHLQVKVDKRTSTFSRLLDRLADRLRG